MKNFAYARAADVHDAVYLLSRSASAKFLAGGTNLVDLMREGIEQPDTVVDVTTLPLDDIEERADGGLSIGATARNTALASHRAVRENYPFLAQAVLFGASGQIRNMATVGGNLMQRTRCAYFYDLTADATSASPDSGCDALGGFNRMHAILGASEHCIAVHPSDMCVALAALDTTVQVRGPDGVRSIPFADFHRLAGDTPHVETELLPGELITGIRDRAARVRAQLALSEGARPRELRLRLGQRRRRARNRKRKGQRRAAGAGRCCAQAMAGTRGRTRTGRIKGHPGKLRARCTSRTRPSPRI